MRHIWLWFLLSFTSIFPLVSEEDDSFFTSSLIPTQNLLPTTIQSISTISGQWLESEIDFITKGVEPIVLTRAYSSSYVKGKLGYNWEFNRPHPLVVKKIYKGSNYFKARIQHPSGAITTHESENTKGSIVSLPLSCTRGLTNCRSGEISGQTNLHNIILQMDTKKDFCELISGNGYVTHYAYDNEDVYVKRHFVPKFERKANGNLLLFKEDAIVGKNADQSIRYGWLRFKNKEHKKLKVKANDGRWARYEFNNYQSQCPPSVDENGDIIQIFPINSYRYCLSKVTYKHKPWIEYEYEHPEHEYLHLPPPNPLLKKKKRPEGRFQEVKYYQKGKNTVKGYGHVKIEEGDFRLLRVKKIRSPVGHDETPITTHRFVYLSDDVSSANKGKPFSGKTIVLDANQHKTVYTYNKEQRPTSIKHYTKTGDCYSKEKFIWDEGDKEEESLWGLFLKEEVQAKVEDDDLEPIEMVTKRFDNQLLDINNAHFQEIISPEEIAKKLLKLQKRKQESRVGNLLGKYLEDGNGYIAHGLFFSYDSSGNISKERFYGNLTGTKHFSLTKDNLQKGEYYEKRFTYSKDGFNHLLAEEEDNGRRVIYAYDSKTCQIAAKYIQEGDRTLFRQFFFYDPKTASLIKVIKDDGSGRDFDDLTDVEERHITCMTLTEMYPIGMPEIIEEKYWDPQSKQEIPLKKIKCHYKDGHLVRQDHEGYDGEWRFCYSLEWEYDDHGNVIREINAEGHEIIKKYDANDNLTLEKGPRAGDEKEYTYDFVNRLIQIKHTTDSQIFLTNYTYDFLGNRTAVIDSSRNKTEYSYDEFGRLEQISYPDIRLTSDGNIRPTVKNTYDISGNLSSITESGTWTTNLTYNARGKPLTKTHPDGRVERFEYYLDGTLAKTIAPNGNETHYQRDAFGRILKETTFNGNEEISQIYTYKGFRLKTKTDGEGNSTEFTYDGAGRLIKEKGDNSCKCYAYDMLGRIQKISQQFSDNPADIRIQAFQYDFLNQVTEERLEDLYGNILHKTQYAYDEMGNRIKVTHFTDSGEKSTKVQYNGLGKPILITDAEGHQTHVTYNYHVQNCLGQFVLQMDITDPKGRITRKTYDALGRLYETLQLEPFSQKILAKQETFYDTLGRPIKSIDTVMVNGSPQREYVNAWRYYYNEQEEFIEEGVGSPSVKRTEWKYNAFGQRETLIKPSGEKIYYRYDPLGRLREIYSQDDSIHYVYTYDRRHLVTQVEDKKNHTFTRRQYDTQGRLSKEILANELPLHYTYDFLSRLKSVTLPDGSSNYYCYNATHLTEIQRYKNGELYRHQNTRYDLSGSLKYANLIGRAGTFAQTCDDLGRIREIKTTHWSQKVPQGGYDPVGCLTAMTTQDSAGTVHHAFTYDNLDHLQTEKGHTNHSYATDSIHNRLQKSGIAYEVNDINQIICQNNFKYRYDSNGNLTAKEKGNEKSVYRYDALDRLISVTSKSKETTYSYDAFNRRVSKTEQGVTTCYIYQGQNEIGAINAQGEITELRILSSDAGAEIGSAIALEIRGKTYAPIHDRQGNVVCLIDASTGKPSETYRYTAFGEETIYNAKGQKIAYSQVGNPWRFSSKRVDPETGWIYFGRRYYDPEIGRWTTPDPLGFADGSNLYAYLHHKPTMMVDAYGLLGEAYRDFCKPEFSRDYFSNSRDDDSSSFSSRLDRPERDNSSSVFGNTRERAGYISNTFSQAAAGICHGGLDFITRQLCDLASIACCIGSYECSDSLEERLSFQAAYHDQQIGHMHAFNSFVGDCLGADPNNPVYQASRAYTTAGLEIGSLAIGGYGLAKGIAKVGSRSLVGGIKTASKVAAKEVTSFTSGGVTQVAKKGGRNRFMPDANATGSHTVFRTDPVTGKVTHYETYRPQTNPRNPNSWESIKRYDGPGDVSDRHYNKFLKIYIETPHIHDPFYSGGVRYPELWEIPR